jgi:hypothetical protein
MRTGRARREGKNSAAGARIAYAKRALEAAEFAEGGAKGELLQGSEADCLCPFSV